MPVVQYRVVDRVALITLDRPPVNSLGLELRSELMQAFERAAAQPEVDALVLTGNADVFCGGADIREFGTDKPSTPPMGRHLSEWMEASRKPVVAAISGVCMGGGLELAMGAHGRVAQAQTRIALPEVRLGLLPGGGGTQRLPRAVGLARALEMIASGNTQSAARLGSTGLFDAVTEDDPVQAACALARRMARSEVPLKRLRDVRMDEPQAEALLSAAREQAASRQRGLLAPLRCIDAVARCLDTPFDEAMRLEREGFLELVKSAQSRARRHVFFAERAAARIDGVSPMVEPRSIEQAGVIGAGTMGGGIAMSLASAGIAVVLCEREAAALERGLAAIRRNYEASASKGRISRADVEQCMARITPSLKLEALRDADLVIEAVFESMPVKEEVFRQLDRICRDGAILATNTSALNVDRIAEFTRRPGDVLGLHFFSPANVMRLLEVVRGAKTQPQVLVSAMALARRIGKLAVVSGVCDGFIGNRMLARYTAAANALILAGALPEQVDGALQRFGMAMGPFRMSDLAGLDIGWATRKRRAQEAGITPQPVVADRLCEAGRFGQKTGAGWYRYEGGNRTPLPDETTRAIIATHRASLGITPRNVSDEEVVQRCIYALVNEGARILDEGIAARGSDIDLVYLNGYGFPAAHGGPLCWADETGLPDAVDALRRFAGEPGADASWQPAPRLLRCMELGLPLSLGAKA